MSNHFSKKLLVSGLLTALGASSGVFADTIELPGTLRDFSSSHSDFEGKVTGHKTGCVGNRLGSSGKPVMVENNDCAMTKLIDWYHDTDASESMPFSITLEEDKKGDSYVYTNNHFYPIDDQLRGNEGLSHNFHFTYELHAQLIYQPGQEFRFQGDDGIWVFINNELVVDIGGVNGAANRGVRLDSLGLSEGETYQFDLFGAERHTNNSKLDISMTLGEDSEPDDEVGGVVITPLPKPELLELTAPADGSQWHIPTACTAPMLTFEGKAAMEAQPGPLDLVLVIDRSGSTEREGPQQGDRNPSVLDYERLAANSLIDMLESKDNARLALISFSRDVTLESPLTDDWASLRDAVAGITIPKGGTNIAAAIDKALEALEEVRPLAQKNILLITDGIPTLPFDSGMTQEKEDRIATLEAAYRAQNAEARIYPIVIQPIDYSRNLTTMPAVQAITGVPGTVGQLGIDNLNELGDVLTHIVLTNVTNVDVTNLTMAETVAAEILLDGSFQADVPMQAGDNELRISAHAGNPDN
ncbi:MAG: fibro-slime domain-containing protein, partial [Candidatus Parabeggiatoa sp.]|nr:fibro-slime domain-containing protein [Candidatus Parabeggiatoa sp.]